MKRVHRSRHKARAQAPELPTIRELAANHSFFPRDLCACLGKDAPDRIASIGTPVLLRGSTLALVCSAKCRGSIILKTYDFVKRVRNDSRTVIVSGFHSPMERQCLEILLARHVPVIFCPARALRGMRIPLAWRVPLAEGRLLILSPVRPGIRRPTRELARYRNEFVAAIAERVLVPYAAAGSHTDALVRCVLGWKKEVCTFRDESTEGLLKLGAVPLNGV